MDNRQPRLLVVEDDLAIRTALEIALKEEGYECRAEENGLELRSVVETFRPDLAVLDVRLGEGPDGYELAQELRKISDAPILFLTAADALDDRLTGFEAGGDDYMSKPFSVKEVNARIKALLRRSGRTSSNVMQIGDISIDPEAFSVVRNGQSLDLTRTEYDLLLALVEKPGRVLSKAQLLARVWGYEDYAENLVEVHMSALRKKLEAHGPRVVQTMRGMGYVFRGA